MPFFECRKYKFDYGSCSVLCKTRRIHFSQIYYINTTKCLVQLIRSTTTTIDRLTIDFIFHLCCFTYDYDSLHSFLSFLKQLYVQVYPPDNHCIKLTRETKTKATISLEKLVKIATKRVLLARSTFLIMIHYSRSISPLFRYNLSHSFSITARLTVSHYPEGSFICTRGRNEKVHDAFDDDSQCLLSLSLSLSLSLDHRFCGSRSTGMQHVLEYRTMNYFISKCLFFH